MARSVTGQITASGPQGYDNGRNLGGDEEIQDVVTGCAVRTDLSHGLAGQKEHVQFTADVIPLTGRERRRSCRHFAHRAN